MLIKILSALAKVFRILLVVNFLVFSGIYLYEMRGTSFTGIIALTTGLSLLCIELVYLAERNDKMWENFKNENKRIHNELLNNLSQKL